MKRRVVLVDDHDVVRQGLRALIGDDERYEVVGEAGSTSDALRVVEETAPDLVLVDLVLGDGPDGIQLTKGLKADHPLLPVLILSGRDESLFAERSLLAGASGYVMKDCAFDVLLDAMADVLDGRIWLSDSMWSRLLPDGFGGQDLETGSARRERTGESRLSPPPLAPRRGETGSARRERTGESHLSPPPLAPRRGESTDAGGPHAGELEAEVFAELRRGNRTIPGVAWALGRRPTEVEGAMAHACERLRLPSRMALILYVQGRR